MNIELSKTGNRKLSIQKDMQEPFDICFIIDTAIVQMAVWRTMEHLI